MKRIAIFGAGIGGLTVAHELSKFPEYQITIYEKKNEIGGLARSGRDTYGCATEISWRVFFNFYHNLFKICSEIPLMEDKNKRVLNNFTPYRHQNMYNTAFTIGEKLISIANIIYGLTSCDNRLDNLDNISWWNSLGSNNKSNFFREIGGWLGMDRYRGSYKSVIRVGFETHLLPKYISSSKYNDWVTTKPTSEAWFDHWIVLLRTRRVNIRLNTELLSVQTDNNSIISVNIYDQINGLFENIIADYYVFCLPIEILSEIVERTPALKYGQLQYAKKLKDMSLHIQLSFQVYFNVDINLGKSFDNLSNNAFLIIDSPWDLIVLQYDKIYIDTYLCTKIPNVKSAWSITVCTAYIPGIMFNKPFNQCSYEEITTEIWQQIIRNKTFKKIFNQYNNFILTTNNIIQWSPLWPTYHFNNSHLTTTEPKFTNNAGTYSLRPNYLTHINNLYIATAYIKETIDVFSMEGACIAGKLVANAISKKSYPPSIPKRPSLFSPLRSFDAIAYKFGLPNFGPQIIIILIILVIILIFFIILWTNKKRHI